MIGPTAAKGRFPYPHRTVAQVDNLRALFSQFRASIAAEPANDHGGKLPHTDSLPLASDVRAALNGVDGVPCFHAAPLAPEGQRDHV
jgi:hypothetical protein